MKRRVQHVDATAERRFEVGDRVVVDGYIGTITYYEAGRTGWLCGVTLDDKQMPTLRYLDFELRPAETAFQKLVRQTLEKK